MPKTAAALPPAPTTAPRSVRRGLACLAFAATTWGTTGAAVDVVYRSSDLGPMAVSFWRFLTGAALLLAARAVRPARRTERTRPPVRRRLLLFAGTGVGLAVFQTAYFAAVRDTGVAVATLVTLGASPVLTAAAARVLLAERVGRGGLLALATALAGLAVLVLGNQSATATPAGTGAALLSATGFAATSTLARWTGRRSTGEPPYTLTVCSFTAGAAATLPLACTEGILPHTAHPARVLLLMLYVATVTTALAYPLYFAGTAAVRAATSSAVMLLEPASAALLAVFLLHEHLTPATASGTILMLTALAGLAATESRQE